MEIVQDLVLSDEEKNMLDMHSVLNVLSVIQYEIFKVEELFGEDPMLANISNLLSNSQLQFSNPNSQCKVCVELLQLSALLESYVFAYEGNHCLAKNTDFIKYKENILNIIKVLGIRISELQERRISFREWNEISVDDFRRQIIDIMGAIERNAKGKYDIVYSQEHRKNNSYLINLSIESVFDECLVIPSVFQDLFRDIVCNARKYTPPGGEISARFYQDNHELGIDVLDNGCGIPDDEIDQVVLYGKRASNVEGRVTRGGGFGLTKALYVTKRFGGRFWIDSKTGENSYTEVKIRVPNSHTAFKLIEANNSEEAVA